MEVMGMRRSGPRPTLVRRHRALIFAAPIPAWTSYRFQAPVPPRRGELMKTLVALTISLLAASGIALASPASAGCQGGWTPWGGGTTCDGPIAGDGTFQRCVTAGAMGFGGTNCFLANINNLAGQVPYVGP
jgi:hypothetical protein